MVHSYAATAIERFLALREPAAAGGGPRLSAADAAPFAQQLLEALFAAFKHPERRAAGRPTPHRTALPASGARRAWQTARLPSRCRQATHTERRVRIHTPLPPTRSHMHPADPPKATLPPNTPPRPIPPHRLLPSGENEYLMRAVMRLISHLGAGIAPVAPICLQARRGRAGGGGEAAPVWGCVRSVIARRRGRATSVLCCPSRASPHPETPTAKQRRGLWSAVQWQAARLQSSQRLPSAAHLTPSPSPPRPAAPLPPCPPPRRWRPCLLRCARTPAPQGSTTTCLRRSRRSYATERRRTPAASRALRRRCSPRSTPCCSRTCRWGWQPGGGGAGGAAEQAWGRGSDTACAAGRAGAHSILSFALPPHPQPLPSPYPLPPHPPRSSTPTSSRSWRSSLSSAPRRCAR